MIYLAVPLGIVLGIAPFFIWDWWKTRRETKRIYAAVDALVKKRQTRQEAQRQAARIAHEIVEHEREKR